MTELKWLGLVSYSVGCELQKEFVREVREGDYPGGILLGCEHPPVITLGKRAKPEIDVVASQSAVESRGLQIHWTDRGGQATVHSPGQLVIYPIVPIARLGWTVREFICHLEKAAKKFLLDLGIVAESSALEPGLWVEGKKIAAVGVRVDRGVTLHGTAINVTNDLELFSTIRNCGAFSQVTSLNILKPGFSFSLEKLSKDFCLAWNSVVQSG